MPQYSIVSWNVNGVRAAERKGFCNWVSEKGYDIVGIQETKVHDQTILSEALRNMNNYFSAWHGATERKGYSGVGLYSKIEPKEVKTFFGENILSREGRIIEAHYDDFVLLNIYFPNGGRSRERLEYKLNFYKEFVIYLEQLQKKYTNIIFMGDVNTAHHEIDLARPKENINTSGFMPIEREWLDRFESIGFVDTFRMFYPEMQDVYTWWDMKTRARARNVGWRIDYVWVSESLKTQVSEAFVDSAQMGSDHCPVGVTLNL